jgi:predicted O-methyltransferase YrrM
MMKGYVEGPALRDVNSVARAIFTEGRVQDEAGLSHPVSSELSEKHADALYRAVLAARPRAVVEIGMAHGISTLAILSALREIGEGGRLVSIDPHQSTAFGAIGQANVNRAGLADSHELIEDYDFNVLPSLLKDGLVIDFGYIDGWHTFDYTLLDFWYLDKMLRPGGVMGFNDCGYRAVNKVLRFVRTHRRYRELDVGLKPDYQGAHPGVTLARRLMRLSHSDRYFQKVEQWEPTWNFYAPF